MSNNRIIPCRARHRDRKEHWQFVLLGLGTLWEGLIMVASLGFLTVDTRAWLFDVFED